MVRNYIKKTNRTRNSPTKLKKGLELVRKGVSLRVAAKESKVNYGCLFRLSKKTEGVDNVSEDVFQLSQKSRSVFSINMENTIAEYCKDMALIGYGLSVTQVKEIAYETALKNNMKIPESWSRDKMAGEDWYLGFMKRHPDLSVRTPEGCSIARAVAFNKHNVTTFFDKLAEVMKRHPSFADGSRVYNLDETCTSTVQNMRKVVSRKGIKQVHKIQSAERGTSVTTCSIVGAFGIVIPPVLIFPRKKFLNCMMFNCFPGSLGLSNKNGYMTKGTFVEVLRHFIKCSNSSKDNPSLLLVDNVGTHLSINALNLAKEFGVTILTFPPHCTHKLQPLDVSVFGPFKVFYDAAVNAWMLQNPGKPVTIYQVAQFVNEALRSAGSINNITSGFAQAGIVPFNRHLFNESDFAMASTSEQPNPNADQVPEVNSVAEASHETPSTSSISEHSNGESSTSNAEVYPNEEQLSSADDSSFVSPYQFKGLPKTKPVTPKRKPRRKGKCQIATDTPEKAEIEAREREKEEKIRKTEENKLKRAKAAELKKQENFKKNKKRKKTKRVLEYSDDSDNSAAVDDDLDISSTVFNTPVLPNKRGSPVTERVPEEGDYVLVLFEGRSSKYFVGKVIKNIDSDGDFEISYLRKASKATEKFVMPNVPDLCSVSKNDIKAILPLPTYVEGKTKRQQSLFNFDFDFNGITLG